MAQLNMLFMSSIESLISEDQLVLPTLPEIAIRAREVAEKPDTSLSDLIKVIHCDTAICARLIKVANSPFVIRASNPVNNITAALTRLGLHFARNLITGLAMEQMFRSRSQLVERKLREVWRTSTRIAGHATIIAKHFSTLPPDEVALAGLVHQIGVLPILSVLEENLSALPHEADFENLITDLHPHLGQHILKTWNFPTSLHIVPKEYLNFQRHHNGHLDCSDIIMIAHLYDHTITGHSNHAVPTWDHISAFQRAGITPEPDTHHAPILDDLRTEFESTASLFR